MSKTLRELIEDYAAACVDYWGDTDTNQQERNAIKQALRRADSEMTATLDDLERRADADAPYAALGRKLTEIAKYAVVVRAETDAWAVVPDASNHIGDSYLVHHEPVLLFETAYEALGLPAPEVTK